jgi:hypothetical protein
MGISIPVASKEQLERQKKAASESEDAPNRLPAGPSLDTLQVELQRIQKMKDDLLISDEEATKLRAKALGIN